jgi:Ser-tRNA(Ala) deacylase AlaX
MVAQSSAQSALALLNELISELPQRPAPTTGKASSPPPTAAKPSVAKAKAAAAPTSCSEDELPATVALYQTDTYLLKSDATVLAVEPLDGGEGWAVVLDQTVFHPQGGGQPADVGTLEGESGAPFAVSMVKKGPTGVVRHEGASPTPPPFAAGSRVRCAVSEQPRLLNARVHSAGHLIDVAMTNSGMASRLRPTKGYHFTPGSYVEYEGDKLDVSERDKLLTKLQVCDVYVFVSVYVCALHVYMATRSSPSSRPARLRTPAPDASLRPWHPCAPAPLRPAVPCRVAAPQLPASIDQLLTTDLQASMDQLVAQSIDTLVQSVDAQQLGSVCPPNAIPADKTLWGSGWVRVVCVGGLGCPCGGTHVANTSELRAVTVGAIKSKGKVTRVSYTVS